MQDARAVTFDCWGTLIYERDPGLAYGRRVEALAGLAGVAAELARGALDRAWERHVALWQQGVASGSPEMAAWALETLGLEGVDHGLHERLTRSFTETLDAAEVSALEGARITLERLRRAGVRCALVCDTGFSPGRVVRRMLDHQGLLEFLELQVFSNEAGVPKPHPRMFETALGGLGTEAHHGIHVGDLRRTDVAGGRGAGMRTVRIRGHYDDQSEHPEADAVADSHAHLRAILGID